MGREYAGILGCIAFFAEMARGVAHQSGWENVTPGAIVAMFGFAAVGYLCGTIAEATIRDSVRAAIQVELASQQPADSPLGNSSQNVTAASAAAAS